jgi:membrane protease YdiL (CAAX protease family)
MLEAAIRIQRKIPESEDLMHELPSEATSSARNRVAGAVAPWWHTALIAVLLVGVSVLGGRAAHRNALAAHHAGRYLFGIGSEWVLLLFTWWGLRLRRVGFAELLGFRRGLQAFAEDLGAAAIFWIAALIVLAAIGLVLRAVHLSAPEKTLMAIAPSTPLEMLLWIALSLSAGFCEEFVFRGYFLRQFASVGAGLWLGVACSSLLFGVSHGYEGAAGMIAITAYGALFCALAIARKSLRPGMIAHAWHDIFSGAMLALLQHFHPL